MFRHRRALRTVATAGSLGVALALAAATPTSAAPSWEVVASGLHSPRSLAVSPDGDVYVAESGSGGTEACAENPELGRMCLGFSGSLTWVNPDGEDERVVTGLPSVANADEALGPMDLTVSDGGRFVASIGLGGSTDFRDAFGRVGRHLGTLVAGELGSNHRTVWADVAAYEERKNPDGGEIDSNPAGIARWEDSFVVADAGGNTVVRAEEEGRFTTLATLTLTSEGAQPVPTAVVRGPDGAWYISQLTGFPFIKGTANIWRLVPGEAPTVYASGLTNVTDLAFHGTTLYAVQIATDGLLSGSGGSLVTVPKDSTEPTVVVGDLTAPYGVAIHDDAAYVSTCSVCFDDGEVIKVSLK